MNKGRMMAVRIAVATVVCLATAASARVPFPVDSKYEDSVRVLVLFNHMIPKAPVCSSSALNIPAPGQHTMEFVVAALDTKHVKHVVVHRAPYATMDTIRQAFPGALPHVIVHVNAGWGGYSGLNTPKLLSWALSAGIGVVEVGDDDVYIFTSLFTVLAPDGSLLPWIRLSPGSYEPMNQAYWLNQPDDTLWLRLQPGNDRTADSAIYPFLNGVVRNTVFKILNGDSTLRFKAAGVPNGRCESDPDACIIEPGYEQNIVQLGYQQGYNATLNIGPGADPASAVEGVFGDPGKWIAIKILQDSLPDSVGVKGLRRGVSISLQPQFLQDSVAAMQIVYDGIMYASLIHQVNPPIPIAGVKQPGAGKAAAMCGALWPSYARVRVADMSGRTVYEGPANVKGLARTAAWRSGVYVAATTTPGLAKTRTIFVAR